MKKLILVVLAVSLLGGLAVWAQQLGTLVTMSGKVIDRDGKPMVGVTVQYTSKDSGRKLTGKTDKKGEYSMVGGALGVYDLVVLQDGNQVIHLGNITVSAQDERAQCYVRYGACTFNVDLAAEAKRGAAQLSPEERRKREEQEKAAAQAHDLNAQFALAIEAEKAGDFDHAISILQSTTVSAPTSDVPWANLAQAYLMARKYNEAVDPLKKAIAIKPEKSNYHMALGDAYAGAGKTDDAMMEYTTASQMDATQAAMAYFKIGAAWTNASTKATDDASRKKDIENANAAFDKAIAAKPDFADAYYQKGINLVGQATYTKDGKIVPAPGTADAFQKYLELEPNGKYAGQAKAMIEGLGAQVQTTFKKEKGKK